MKDFVRGHPVVAYFVLKYAISWIGAFLLVAPKLWRREPLSQLDGILMLEITGRGRE